MKVVLFGLIISLGGFASLEITANQKLTSLEPVLKYSFCTIYGKGYSLSFVGEKWALELSFASKSYPENATAEHAIFHRGPDIYKYMHRPAGPRMPDPPDKGEYSKDLLTGVRININQININPEKNFGFVEASVESFTVNGEVFYVADPVELTCKGPKP